MPSLVLTQGGGHTAAPRVSLASAPGTLDASFNGTGLTTLAGSNGATGVAAVPPGVGGAGDTVVSSGDGSNFQVGRFTPSGSLDTSFGVPPNSGLINAFPGGALAVAVVPASVPFYKGSVLVAGYRSGGCAGGFDAPVVAEYLPNGTLNTSGTHPFGSGTGIVTIPCAANGGQLDAVAVDSSGNIYLAGFGYPTSGAKATEVAKLSPLGGISWSRTQIVGSQVSGNSPSASQASGVGFSPSGQLIAAGTSTVNGSTFLTVSAFTAGALDTTFHESGSQPGSVSTTNFPGSSGAAVTVLPNGNIVAAGSDGTNFMLAQFGPTGAAVSGFGSSGIVRNSPNLGLNDSLNGVAYAPGNILSAVGVVGSNPDMVVTQYNASTGAPNLWFGPGGFRIQSAGAFGSQLTAVAVQADGKTVGAGDAPVVNAAPGLALMRVHGPAVAVGSLTARQVFSSAPITVNFPVALSEPLFAPVSAVFCATPGASVNHQGRCGRFSIPAGFTRVNVPVNVAITTAPGQSQVVLLQAQPGNGLSPGSPSFGSITIQHIAIPQPYVGYRLVASDGGIFTFGTAPYKGSTGAIHLVQPIVGMAAVPHGTGYWIVARDGGIFTFGATYHGSAAALHPAHPIIGMAATPSGKGYWLAASDGGIYSFGDAHFFGSAVGRTSQPFVGIAAAPDGSGYWLATRGGQVFNFGHARALGSAQGLNKPIVGIAAYPGANGYWLVATDGGIFSFGSSQYHGSTGARFLNKPIVGMASTFNGQGYWLVASDGGIFAFGNAHYYGSKGGAPLNKPIVGMSS